MAVTLDLEAVTAAISGMGVDEQALISTLGNSHKDHRKLFRKASKNFFVEDEERAFEKCDDNFLRHLKLEFSRFNNAVVMWAMHPWERDARLVKKALKKGAECYNLIVEVSCTRSSEDLLGARKAYHSLFDQSMEEDIASHVHGSHRKLLVGLVSAYRYEGNKVKEDSAKSDAKILAEAVASSEEGVVEKDEVVRILSTRSKLHLQHVYKHFNQIKGSDLLGGGVSQSSLLNEALLCLLKPSLYFSKILNASLNKEADKGTKKWLTRVVVTRADQVEMKEIAEEYNQLYGETLAQNIQEKIKGNYRDFLLTLLSKSN
uniref:Annexin D4 n=1 Tax=Noccaea caerulescens TaxID=107243 RepID=A0A1J3IMP3_NOCCA